MTWKDIVKEITEDTNIQEMDELTSVLERMTKVFGFDKRSFNEGYDFMSKDKVIDNNNKIQDLLLLYEKTYSDRYISDFRGSGEIGYHIDVVLGEGKNRFGFEMFFGHFGEHYIHMRGVKRLDKKEADFLSKLMDIIA